MEVAGVAVSEEKAIEKREKIVSNWLKDKYNLMLVGTIILAAIVRFYFLAVAKNQAHWWDSLAFGSIAKEMVYHHWTNTLFIINESVIRPPFFSMLWSWLIRLNFSDFGTLILLEIIPSILSVLFVYLLAKELYNRRVALVSSFILAVLWIHLFYSVRIMSDVPSLFFTIASLYFFAKSYEKIELKPFALAVFFIALATLTRYFFGIIAIIYILVMIFVHGKKLVGGGSKNFWLGGFIGALPLLIFFVINFMTKGSLLPAFSYYSGSAAEKPAFAFYTFNFIYYVLGKMFTLLLISGTLIVLWELLIGFDKIRDIKSLKSNLLLLLVAVIPLGFFVFWLRAAEDRYLFLAMPAIIVFTALGVCYLYDIVRKYSKYLAIALVVGLLLFGAYGQLTFAKTIIDNKKTSYSQMRDAFTWIKDNTPDDAVILGDAIDPYIIFYAERRMVNNWSHENIAEDVMKADYVILHSFENQGRDLIDYVNNRTGTEFIIQQAYFFDAEQKQPAVIIYAVNKNYKEPSNKESIIVNKTLTNKTG